MNPHGRPNNTAAATALRAAALRYPQSVDPSGATLTTDWQYQLAQQTQQTYLQDPTFDQAYSNAHYGGTLQSSPVDYMPSTTAPLSAGLSMDASSLAQQYMPMSAPMESMNALAYQVNDFQSEMLSLGMTNDSMASTDVYPQSNLAGTSPTDSWLEVRSLSSSDPGWNNVDFQVPPSRQSLDSYTDAVFNPSQTLHIRTGSDSSDSDVALSAHSFSSYEEIPFPLHSPHSESNLELAQAHTAPNGLPDYGQECDLHHHSPHQHAASTSTPVEPIDIKHPVSSSVSPSSSGMSSPPNRRKKSPVSKTTKAVIKKVSAHSGRKEAVSEKKVGRRRGPLRPDQRQQAHEIRKLRACLRCKFLKKTCDKGDPCGGCQPSHTRLWQVPCTRIDIKDIAYFMKDWKADYERHVTLGFSVDNIKGFSQNERTLYITHGYGHYLPINAREVYVRDENVFGLDWVETWTQKPKAFELDTARLTAGMEGISASLLSEYIDRHIDGGFEKFIDDYFEGTKFLTEILKTAYRYYLRERLPVIRKALKLVIAYNLTMHFTMVEGLSEQEGDKGKIADDQSKFNGKTVAPVMINFQVKCALANMWRELQKDILEELSTLYSSVYSGEKLKNWPTIFMLAAILLAVWEEMQFDCHYRVPDNAVVEKFCNDMEATPVGVIVGLFQAISQRVPAFNEWDSRKHHFILNSNPAVCDAMTEVRGHVNKYENYLKSRTETKFDRDDFDCLSNKFLSKLVIRAN
ncbi:putative Zn(II)2Cys6 transcription factor [Viridothelium virens]|uniref:Putative Zn(II)2Cys6 transcription factor n=1 Tax=Viridothelium virens TaxID=1048519 RepID=A0A6A6H820_VIRVR|nr:putative Zn(II)2Cys6 transcription factor [Viridothelium virens]